MPNSGADVLPPGFTEDDSPIFDRFPESLNSIRAIRPRNCPVHHPGDTSLLASLCQHFSHSLTRSHTVCGKQFPFHCPLLCGTCNHWAMRAAGEDLCRHMVLGASKHQPVVELPWGPGGLPASVLHCQSQLLQVPWVSVLKGWIYGFIFIRAGLRLGGCLT